MNFSHLKNKFFTIVIMILLSVSIFSCQNNKSSKAAAPVATSNYMLNAAGMCVDRVSQAQVAQNLCSFNQIGQCMGDYWIWANNSWNQIRCTGANCTNMTVYPNGATSELQGIRCL